MNKSVLVFLLLTLIVSFSYSQQSLEVTMDSCDNLYPEVNVFLPDVSLPGFITSNCGGPLNAMSSMSPLSNTATVNWEFWAPDISADSIDYATFTIIKNSTTSLVTINSENATIQTGNFTLNAGEYIEIIMNGGGFQESDSSGIIRTGSIPCRFRIGITEITPPPTQEPTPEPTGEPTEEPPVFPTPDTSLPSVWKTKDIGTDMIPLQASYYGGTYTIEGADPVKTDDGVHFIYQTMSSWGNGEIVARVKNAVLGTTPGVMIRETLEPNSPFVSISMNSTGMWVFSWRITTGGDGVGAAGMGTIPGWVKLVKDGTTFTGFVSPDGASWTQVGSKSLEMTNDIHIGLCIDGAYQTFKAEFENVDISYEGQPNRYELYNRYLPSITPIENGYVVVWESAGQDGSSSGVYGQRFDTAGNKLGNEFQINTYTTYNQGSPDVTALTDGFVVVWQSYGQDGSNHGIYGQRFDTYGNRLGNEFLINTHTADSQDFPDAAELTDGFVVVWQSYDQDGSNYGIYGQRFDTDGNKLGNEFLVNTYTYFHQRNPDVTALTNGFVVVWQSFYQDGSNNGIYGQRFDTDGNKLGNEFLINTYTTGSQYTPDVAELTDGFVVVWSSYDQDGSYDGVYGQRFDTDGNRLGNEFLINTYTTDQQANSRVAKTMDGFIVVWQSNGQDGSDYGIYGQRFDVDGNIIGEEFRINKYTYLHQYAPDITAINNDLFVAWGSKNINPDHYSIFLRQYTLQDLDLLLSAGDGTPLPGDEWVTSPIVDVNAIKALPYAPGTSGVDPATFEYSIDSGAWQQQGDEVSFFTEGTRTVSFRARYPEGGYCIPKSTEVMMDVTAPLVDIDVNISTTSMTFTATADDILSGVDPGTWFYSVDGEPLTPGYSVTIPEVRNCEIYFEVRDHAGNLGYASEIILVDVIPPGITATGVEWTNAQTAYARAGAADTGTGASGVDPDTWCYRFGSTGEWIPVPGITSPDEEVSVEVTEEGITTVYFMVSDHAGNSAEAACEVKIDRTPPGIFPGIVDNVFVQDSIRFKTIPLCYDPLSGVMPGSLEYSVDTYEPGQWYSVQQEIDVSGVEEGDHTLYFRAEDIIGNAGVYEEGLAFIIDRTDPVLASITIKEGKRILLEHVFSPADTVNAKIDASDVYGTAGTGIVAGYFWVTSDTVLPEPGLVIYNEAGSSTFDIKNLINGINYLYVYVVDAAGNRSSTAERIIRVDTETPGQPAIESLTHPEAYSEEDAVALSDAVFTIIPGTVGPSGVFYYTYELNAGTSAGSGAIRMTPGRRIELTGLDDNLPGEFYFLSVRVIGGNGMKSPPAEYVFRIDTTPPQNLTVQSATHSKPDTYYASGNASFSWNRPLDFTGISSYYYTVSTTPVLPNPVPEGYMHSGVWTATELQAVSIHLPGITDPSMEAGQVFFAVCAEDYSGNRQYDEISILFDTVKPWIVGEITVVPTMGTRSVYVSWPVPDDNIIIDTVPQVSHSEVKLFTVEPDGTMVDASLWIPKQMNETQEHEFTGLSGDLSIVYAVTVKVIDKAGNEMQYSIGFKLDGEIVELAVPFTEIVGGYLVSGQYSNTPAQREAALIPAAGLHLKVNGVPVDSITLGELAFSDEVFEAGTNPAITYTVTIAGYTFTGTGLSISQAEGLTFQNLTLTIPTGEDEEKSIDFTGVGVTAPPQIQFEPALSAVTEGFSYQSLREQTDPGVDPESCWAFNDITITGLNGPSWLFKDGVLDFTSMSETKPFQVYILEDDDTHNYKLPIIDVSITPDRQTGEGEVLPGFILEAADNFFLVRNALLRGEKLVILEAQLLLEGYSSDEIIIENFSVDIDGNIVEEPGFSHTPFTLTVDGLAYTVTELHFTGNQLVVSSGSIDYPDGAIPITDAVLTSNGIISGTIGFFDQEYSGFRVTSDSGRITAGGIVFEDALLYLPGLFIDETRQEPVLITLYGLTVALSDKQILVPGSGQCDLALITPYGEGVQAKELTLTSDGLFASIVEVTLPGFLQPEEPTITLTNLQLVSDGTIFDSDEYEMIAFSLPETGLQFQLYGFQVKLTPAGLLFRYVDTALTEEYTPEVISFTGFTVNNTGVVTPGIVDDPVDLYTDGWDFKIEDLTLDRTGIHGIGNIQLPYEFGYMEISFPDFQIFPGGNFDTGASVDEVYIRIHNWLVRATDISISGNTITLGQAAVMLYSIMGWGELVVPDVVIGSDGSLISSSEGTTSVEFFAVNGFKVNATRYHFTQDGLYLAGDVYFPPALGDDVHTTFTNKEIALESDGCIITPVVTGSPVTYKVAGFDVLAEDFYFDRGGLTIGSSTVTIPVGPGIDVVFPSMQFYPDGNIKVAGQSFKGFTFPVGLLEFSVSDIRLNEEGVNIKAFIKLPPRFGDDSVIYFDKLTIHPDRRITSDVVVSHFRYEAERLGMVFDFKNIGFDAKDGFFIGEAIITLPAAMDNKNIRITDLAITPEGEFKLRGLGVDPFKMWGYVFYIDNISFTDSTLSFIGGMRFPYDFVIDQLAGVRVNFDTISYNFDTKHVSFTVSCDKTFTFPLVEGYDVDVKGITVSNTGVDIDEATMHLPEELGIGSVSVTEISLYHKDDTWSIDFDKIKIQNIDKFTFLGCEFEISEISFNKQWVITFKGTVQLPMEGVPGGIAGKTLTITNFEILPGLQLGDISASIGDLEATLFDGMIELSDGSLSLTKEGSDLYLGCSGSLTTGEDFPGDMKGKTLILHEFEIHIWDSGVELTKFDASTTPLTFTLLGLYIENAVIRIVKETGDNETPEGISVTVTGYTDDDGVEHPLSISIDPDIRPSFIHADDKIIINLFRFDPSMDWELDASLRLSGTRELFAGIDLVDYENPEDGPPVLLTAKKELGSDTLEFALSGSLVFNDTYPEGIAGTKVEITNLRFDSNWEPLTTDITVYLGGDKEIDFYDIITLSDVVIHITDYETADEEKLLSFDFSGTVELNLPPDLGIVEFKTNPVIKVEQILLISDGTVEEVSISVSQLNMTIVGALAVQGGALEIIQTETDTLKLTFTGDLTLPGEMTTALNLDPSETPVFSLLLIYDTGEGITEFGAGLASPFTCDIFSGIELTVSGVDIDTKGMGMTCSLKFIDEASSPFPEGLKGISTTISFAMDWDGTITEMSGTIPGATIKLAGFTADVINLTIDQVGISFESCTITLPEVLKSKQIAIKNAGYTWEGDFYGEITIPVIEIPIAGFTLKLYNPDLSFDPAELACSKVTIVGPAFLKSFELTLRGVSITKDGIDIAGGKFELPDFTIAGGLGFKDIAVEFSIEEVNGKKQYFIEGGGKVIVPGAGTFSTTISFINKSKTYPWGIKRAYFEYTIRGLGLPIATTGLYLNKIRGGLAFGPPDELPEDIQPMFDEGTRIQIGVSITDATKKAVTGDVDVWIDITDWDWAFEGKISVLSGIIKARIAACLTKKGFYGDLQVQVAFVRGRVYVYIFKHPKTKKTVVSGGGSLQFGLAKGCILKKTIKIWRWKIRIYIPWKDFWLPSLYAEFGLFTKDGKEVSGFKGYVKVPCFGKIGVFKPRKGKLELGSKINKYILYTPTMRSSTREGNDLLYGQPESDNNDSRVTRRDTMTRTGITETFLFSVLGEKQQNNGVDPLINRANGDQSGITRDAMDASSEEEVERIVFFIFYPEGEPVLRAISPSGKVYTPGHPDVELEYFDSGYGMVVFSPETGEWTVEVSNVINSEAYHLEVYGKTALPEISVETPAYAGEHAGSSYTIKGSTTLISDTPAHINMYLARDKDYFVGEEIAETDTDANGNFSAQIDTSTLSDGEYHIYCELEEDDDDPSVKAFAPGSIVVYNSDTLAAVEDFTAAENTDNEISISFSDPNGDRTKGFHLHIHVRTSGGDEKEEIINIGYLTDMEVPGFDDGDEVTLVVVPYDELNREGAASQSITVIIGEVKDDTNDFTIVENTISLELEMNSEYTGTLTCQTPGYQITGTAYDWMEARVSDAPDGLGFAFSQSLYNIAQPETEISYYVTADETLLPGTYSASLVFENRGNRELSEEVSVTLTVTYPQVECNDVLPEVWNTLDDQELELFGDHFYEGTRVYVDIQELVVLEMERNYIKVIAPAGIPEGEHQVRVIGPGGDEAVMEVTVEAPHYSIDAFKTQADTVAGYTENFYFTIRSENRFDGFAYFQPGVVPAGWSVSITPPSVSPGETATISVEIPISAQIGANQVTVISDQGDEIIVDITITDTYPDPTISSVVPFAGFVGDEITILGYGFGDNGTVMINNTQLDVVSYTRDTIMALMPEGAVTGNITVVRDTLASNPHIFYVKERGFTIYTEQEEITLKPGESETIALYINGYEDYVNLSVETNDDAVQATVIPGSVIPNGMCELSINVSPTADFDLYQATVTGTGSQAIRTKVINIIVGQAFAITTETLPKGMEETTYRAELTAENGEDPIVFDLEEKSVLPYGLRLSNAGVISGTPKEAGTWMFTVVAEDFKGRKAEKDFAITIEENAWIQENKGPGRTRHNGVKSPADSRTMWESDSIPDAKEILTAKGRVFVLSDVKVTGLEQRSGKTVYDFPGEFTQWAYAQETLYLLDETGVFHAVESRYGNEKWSRENITCFTTDGNNLFLSENGQISIINIEDGTYMGSINNQLVPGTLYVWQNGTLLKTEAHKLLQLTDSGWTVVYEDEYTEAIIDAACDEVETALLTEYGRLIILDAEFNKLAEKDTGIEYGMIALGSERITLASDTEIVAYERATLTELFFLPSGCTELATAEEKVFTVSLSSLQAINGYDGTDIWAIEEPHTDIALAGEFVYALNGCGEVTCYNGPDNIYPPTTTLTTSPLQPDGELGYFITQPTVTLTADDLESYVASTTYRLGQNEETAYTEPLTLPEGQYSFLWYSRDSHGYREQDNITHFKVDYIKPESEITITGIKGEGIYYLTGTTISLSATDNYSGIDRIEYNLNSNGWTPYSDPLSFTDEGHHLFTWRAKDLAGNYEAERTLEFAIDLYSPVASHSIWSEPGITVVYLEAEDSSSGIKQLLYYVDGILYETYTDPIVLTEPGEHTINYMAIDNAGRNSGLTTMTVDVEEFSTGEWIENLRFACYKPGRELVRNVQTGERLYGPVRNSHNKDRCDGDSPGHGPGYGGHNQVKALPGYLVGADFIRTHYSDKTFCGKSFITFTAKADIDVFIMKHKKSRADLSGWTLVEQDFPVEPVVYFKGGADIYTQSYRQGDTVVIPGSCTYRGWGNLVFIQYAQGNYIKIINPAPGVELVPFTTERYGVVVLGLEYDSILWHKRTGNGDWEELGTGLKGELEVPFVEKTTTMELRVSLYDSEGEVVAQRTAGYVIRNEFEIILLHPGPGTEVLPEEEVTLIYTARDAKGNTIPGEQVAWTYSTDQVNWMSMAGNTFTAPAEPGRVHLKGEAESFPGVLQQVNFFVDVVETYGTTLINFGKIEGEDYTLGETAQLHATGKCYGFNEDHTDRIETFMTVKPNQGRVDETAIRLKENGVFEYTTGNGIYLVKAVFGPIDNQGHGHHYPHHKYDHNSNRCYGNKEMTAVIEGREIVIKKWGWNVRVYEVLVTVEDGRLTLTGAEGLPVMQLDVRELTEEEGVKRKGWPPETGPPRYGNKDEDEDWKNYEKGGRR